MMRAGVTAECEARGAAVRAHEHLGEVPAQRAVGTRKVVDFFELVGLVQDNVQLVVLCDAVEAQTSVQAVRE